MNGSQSQQMRFKTTGGSESDLLLFKTGGRLRGLARVEIAVAGANS